LGLFSGSSTTYVSSSAWNMAGEYNDRFKVVPNMVLSAVTGRSGSGGELGEIFRTALLNSSAMAQKRFFIWAVDNYDLGIPTGHIAVEKSVDASLIRAELESTLLQEDYHSLQINSAVIDFVDEAYWAEEYITNNRPLALDDPWLSRYDSVAQTITVVFAPGDEESFPAPADFLWGLGAPSRRLLFVNYQIMVVDEDSKILQIDQARLFSYRLGTGNATYDAVTPTEAEYLGQFFPSLPIRIKNQSLSTKDYVENVTKAYKKITRGGKISTLLEQIEEHENVDDMDYAFVTFGVSLNTKDKAGKEYLYKFFELMLENQEFVDLSTVQSQATNALAADAVLDVWKNAHTEGSLSPLFGTAAPDNIGASAPDTNSFNLRMPGLDSYDMRVSWAEIDETTVLGNAGANNGVNGYVRVGETVTWYSNTYTGQGYIETSQGNDKTLHIARQITKQSYKLLRIRGLVHVNKVYGSKSVTINAGDAMEDSEESGFIVPLHYPTMKSMSMTKQAQLATCNMYMVINSYEIVRQKWYQTGAFKVLLVIASIALSVVTAGGSLAAAGGILGTNAAVGAMLGLGAGAAAAVAGAVVNALAGMIIGQLISTASVAIFGDKWGQVIAIATMVVVMSYSSAYAQTGTFEVDWSQLAKAENLIKLTSSVSQGYNAFLNADTLEIMEASRAAAEEYGEEMKEMEELSRRVLGMTGPGIDGMMFLNEDEYFQEPSEGFFKRTLMTGSDIAELTRTLVYDFAEINLTLPLAST